MATLSGALQAAHDVEHAGEATGEWHAQPSVTLALWASCLSAQKQLDANGRQAAVVRPFTTCGLPAERAHLYALIANFGDAFLSGREVGSLYYIEWLDREGSLARFARMPETLDAWYTWREDLLCLLAGHGCSRKMVSFAAFLLWPSHCQLVPCDRHVFARLHETEAAYHASSRSRAIYLRVEARVADEWIAAGSPDCLGLWHWQRWSQYRQAVGVEPVGDACESHQLLSPYWYPAA